MEKRKTYDYLGKHLYKEQIAKRKGYYIDKEGNVYYKGKPRVVTTNNLGYKVFTIKITPNIQINIKCHRLQAYQKFGDKLYKKGFEVRHLNNNPGDNSFQNIAIGNHSQNYKDSLPEVRQVVSQKGGDANRKYNHLNVLFLRSLGLTYNEISTRTGIKKGMISWILNHSTQSKVK